MRLLTHEQAVALIVDHGVIVYPTSTLYGIGCNAMDRQAVKRVSSIKQGRDAGFICLVSGIEMAEELAFFNKMDLVLAKRFWPGPLTLVLNAKPGIEHLTATDRTVALRCDPMAMPLVKDAKMPIVSTSANLPGRSAARVISEIDPAVSDMVDGVLPASSNLLGRPSTIVRSGAEGPQILREGAIENQAIIDAWRG